ncbi:MAG: acyl-ACP--UDP-N-acetylglucosamine O-acyltransferase [Planctomycetia bacterium]|nr:acyl-ACP--UDP-N-acetylglucosamine O-acyltransferase [Planctomycetia bacterium]
MTHIHPQAVVSPDAVIGSDVSIGPFCLIEAGAQIGDGCRLESGVVIHGGTVLGAGNRVCHGAVLGGIPQHLKAGAQVGGTAIGSGNTIREHVTVHHALEPGHSTLVGDNNLLMVNVHVAHDCRLGSNCVMVNNAMLAGHVEVEDRAYLAGGAAAHQFVRIGKLAMVGGMARCIKDVPPFVTVDGATTTVVGLNLVGLRRAGYKTDEIAQLKAAYRLIYRSGLPWTAILEQLPQQFPEGAATEYHRFFGGGKRGFTPARKGSIAATIHLHDEGDGELRSKVG